MYVEYHAPEYSQQYHISNILIGYIKPSCFKLV